MRTLKRIRSLGWLCIMLLWASSLGAQELTVGQLTFHIQDGAAQVAGTVGKVTNVRIPATVEYDGQVLPVTEIGFRAFRNCRGLVKIEIPTSVKVIGPSAFYGCSNLRDLIIPNSVTTIDKLAFAYSGVSSANLVPKSVTYIAPSAFKGCKFRYCSEHAMAYEQFCPVCHGSQVEKRNLLDANPRN